MWHERQLVPLRRDHAPLDKLRRWHPLNQSLYVGLQVHLAGLLLSGKGDRTLRRPHQPRGDIHFLMKQVTDFLRAITA